MISASNILEWFPFARPECLSSLVVNKSYSLVAKIPLLLFCRTFAIFATVFRWHQYFPGACLSAVPAAHVARIPPPFVPHAVRRADAFHPERARLVICRIRSVVTRHGVALRPEVAVVFPSINVSPVMAVFLYVAKGEKLWPLSTCWFFNFSCIWSIH